MDKSVSPDIRMSRLEADRRISGKSKPDNKGHFARPKEKLVHFPHTVGLR